MVLVHPRKTQLRPAGQAKSSGRRWSFRKRWKSNCDSRGEKKGTGTQVTAQLLYKETLSAPRGSARLVSPLGTLWDWEDVGQQRSSGYRMAPSWLPALGLRSEILSIALGSLNPVTAAFHTHPEQPQACISKQRGVPGRTQMGSTPHQLHSVLLPTWSTHPLDISCIVYTNVPSRHF